MKAWVLHGVGDLRLEEVPRPKPGAGEVLVRVAACGVCGSDIPRIFTKGTYRFPTIPGHEFAGTVEALGEGVSEEWQGARVAVSPLIPCYACAQCRAHQYELCTDYDYLGSRRDGGFAEFVASPARNLGRVPDSVGFESAAMTEPAAVALHALRRTQYSGESVAILGAGPIGMLIAVWARELGGADVWVGDIDEARLELARTLGFETFNPMKGALPAADMAIEGSGAPAALPTAIAIARPAGTIVLVGNPAGAMPLEQNVYWAILRKQLRLLGAWNSSFRSEAGDDWCESLNSMSTGRLNVRALITHRLEMEQLMTGLEIMRDRTELCSKVMLVLGE